MQDGGKYERWNEPDARRSVPDAPGRVSGAASFSRVTGSEFIDKVCFDGSASGLAYWAARIDQRIASCAKDRLQSVQGLLAARRALHEELQLREGLLLTLATPCSAGFGVMPGSGPRSRPKLARDPRLGALFLKCGR